MIYQTAEKERKSLKILLKQCLHKIATIRSTYNTCIHVFTENYKRGISPQFPASVQSLRALKLSVYEYKTRKLNSLDRCPIYSYKLAYPIDASVKRSQRSGMHCTDTPTQLSPRDPSLLNIHPRTLFYQLLTMLFEKDCPIQYQCTFLQTGANGANFITVQIGNLILKITR